MPTIYTSKELEPRRVADAYPTPQPLVRAAVKLLPYTTKVAPRVLDVGAGDGRWGEEILRRFRGCLLYGVEVRGEPDVRPHLAYAGWHTGDFLGMGPSPEWMGDGASSTSGGIFDYVVGNPPYSLAQPFLERGLSMLRLGGTLLFLLPAHFLAGQARKETLYDVRPPRSVYMLTTRPNFEPEKGSANPDIYFLGLWSNTGSARAQALIETRLRWLDWREAKSEAKGVKGVK